MFAGDAIQLRHLRSKKYLTIRRRTGKEEILLDRGSRDAELIIDLKHKATEENIPI